MGSGHGHRLHYHGHSPIHRARPELKLVALVGLMLGVVATPPRLWPLYLLAALVVLVTIRVAQVPYRYLAPRMLIETPVLVFVAILPFVATGPRIDVGPFSVSESGLVDAGALAAKATIGVAAALTLAATTEAPAVLLGLRRLKVPALLVEIMGFMIRYLDMVTADVGRTVTAMRARGVEPTSPRHWPSLARAIGSVFIRAYERGERVHVAMLSRGYSGGAP